MVDFGTSQIENRSIHNITGSSGIFQLSTCQHCNCARNKNYDCSLGLIVFPGLFHSISYVTFFIIVGNTSRELNCLTTRPDGEYKNSLSLSEQSFHYHFRNRYFDQVF